MTRWFRRGLGILMLLGVFLGGAGSAAALSPVDVLIVNDGHTLQDQSVLPDHGFVPTYRRALEPVENVNITVRNVSALDIGPDREVMGRYDVVIWYTLWDYGGNPNCPESGTLNILGLSQEECRTFYGDPSDPGNGVGDIQNITRYLRRDNGRIILTGHKIDFENSRTSFYRNVLRTLTAFSGGPKYYECPKEGDNSECTQLSKGDISNQLRGESGDPVTENQFFTVSINTTIEPKSERGVFQDYCKEEWPLFPDFEDSFCDPLVAQDMFTWKHSNSSKLYTHSHDDDESSSCCTHEGMEDYAHSMTRVNASDYKTVYAGFGFEAIISERKRQRLMNQSINYLIGPRVDTTTVRDNDDIPGTPTDEGAYANGTVNVTATCINNQLQTGTHISAAQFFDDADFDTIPDTPRANRLGDGTTMSATDGNFEDERHEAVEYLDWNHGISSTSEEGENVTVAVQCRDTTNSQYWGQYEKDWFVFDDNPPEAPDDVRFTAAYTNDALANITVDYALFSEPNRGQLVRFSCDQSNWGDWRVYNQANDVQNFTVNTTDTDLGCSTTDGNRTVHVQARDYAGNMPGITRSDFIVLDRQSPDFRAVAPANGSFVRETDNVTVNATDTLSGVETGAAHRFDNGTLNQSFTINESFDPDWTTAGEQTLETYVFDQAGNVLTSFFRFTIDLNPPVVDSVSPSNDSVVRSTDTITVTVSDATANVSRLAAYNGTAWQNFTVSAGQNTTGIHPGWTDEGPNTLTLWLNDTVDRVRQERYHYDVDDSPPAFLSFTPANGSFVRSDDALTIDIVDRFAAGIANNVFGRDGVNETFTANQSFSPGWTTEGLHNVTVWSNDTLAHYNTTFLQYTIDDTPPSVDSITPSGTFLNASGNITVTVSDTAAGIGLGRRYNGTHNETFQSGVSFDPGWTSEGLHTLDIWVNDTVGNMRTDAKTWELDTTAPRFVSVTPANTSYIDTEDTITIDASDGAAGLSVGRAFNGTHNTSITDESAFDPGWTASATHGLRVWFNDTVQNMNRTNYTFLLDPLPPSLAEAQPANTSHIRSDENITLTVTDRGPDGGVGRDTIRAFNGTHNLTVSSGEDFAPGWSEGVRNLTVFKNDTLGNTNSTFLEYTVDDTAPSTTDNHTFGGWRTTNKTIGVNTTDNFGADLVSTCTYDNLTADSCTPAVTGVPNVTVTAGCVSGDTCQPVVSYRANDTAGNVEDVRSSANVSIDREAPLVDFVTPRDGQTVAGTIDIEAVINDAGIGTDITSDRVQYSIVNRSNDNVVQTGLLNDTLDTNTITTGTATAVYNISAIDRLGNAVNRTNVTFTIDNRGVVTNIEQPDRTFVNGDFSVDLRALRPGGGVGNMTFNITNSTGFLHNRTTRGNIHLERDNFTDTVFVNDTKWWDDNLTLQFGAQSNNTNRPITKSLSETWFVLDRLRPNTSIADANGSWVSGTKQVSYTANATDPWGMDRCRWQYRNSSVQNWQGNFSAVCGVGNQFDFDTTNCQDDADPTCTVRLFGRDQAGNVNSSTVQFRVDNSPPTVSIDTPHAWKNSDFSVAHSEADPQGFTRTYHVNNSAWQPLTDSDITVDISQWCTVEGSKACNVSVNATNNVGDTVMKSRRYSIDTSRPVIESIAPVNGSNLTSADDIRIDFDASVAGKQTAVFNSGTGNQSFKDSTAFDPGWTAEGEHTLTVWVVDRAGNVLRRHLVYTVDDTPPVFLSEAPANGSSITPADALTVDINDTVTGVEVSEFDKGDGINRSFPDDAPFDPLLETDGFHWIDLYLTDFSGNVNHSALRYFVDGTPPAITLVAPANGSVIRQDRDLTVNASDAGVGVGLARFTNTDTGQTVFFTPNQSFDPGWTSQGRRLFEPVLNDTLNNTGAKRFYFTTDGTPPNINAVETNISIVAEGGAVDIRADVVENYSSIGLVRANIIDAGGSVIDRLTLTRFGGSATHNTTFTAPTSGTQDLTVNITANDTLRHRRFNTALEVTVDATPPNATASRFNVSTDAHFGDTRIYRGAPIAFQVNLTENGAIATATVTVNATSNPATGTNHTLALSQGTVSRGVWNTTITDTDQVGIYNITRLYLNDTVANHNSTANVPLFRVVNQTLNASLADTLSVDAGHTVGLNLSVDFNRSRSSPSIQVFIPPAAPGALTAPSFTNQSAYTCSFGTGCTVDPITAGGGVASLNVSAAGTGRHLFITAPVRAATPAADTARTWTLRSVSRTQKRATTITAPFLNVSQVFCGQDTNCTVTQNTAFTMNVTVNNTANATHSGLANDTQVNISATERGITNSTGIGDLPSGGVRNATFQVNLTVAGDTPFDINGFDGLTGAYVDRRSATVTARDSVPPNSSDRSLGRKLLNPGQSVTFELTAVDNVAVGTVQATVLNTTGPRQNFSLSLDSGDLTQGIWEFTYDETGTEGRYNVTRLYLNDTEGNVRSVPIDKRFRVVEFTVNTSFNTTTPAFGGAVRIRTNVTGNVSDLSRISANISKPRGFLENISLSRTAGVHDFAATYTNISRSGPFVVNTTAVATRLAWNDTMQFSTPFGTPSPAPLDGNGTHIVLPQTASPYTVSWHVTPADGDLEDVNTTLAIENKNIVDFDTGETNFSFLGNVTAERGPTTVTYNLTDVSTGTTTVTLTTNTSRGTVASKTVAVNVSSADTADPNITGFRDTPGEVNKQQEVTIRANASDRSILENATIIVHHPDTGSNVSEPPQLMDRTGRGQYRHRFSNTNETGHYTYEILTWDISGNRDRIVSNSFNVSGTYTVTVSADQAIYRKGEEATFTASITDVNGDPVPAANTTMVLDRSGSNTTLLPNNETDTGEYTIRSRDPPGKGASADSLPFTYTLFANVSEDSNTGFARHRVNVTRLITRDEGVLFDNLDQGDNVAPGSEFTVQLAVNYPDGTPVTEAVVFVRCNTCPSDFRFLDHQGNGIYRKNFTAPTDEDSALIRAFVDDGLGNSESQNGQAAPAISLDVTEETGGTGGGGQTGGTGGTGGGGGGGGAIGPSLEIERISPPSQMPPTTATANLSVRTSDTATCRYAAEANSFGQATPFTETGGSLHYALIQVQPGTSYNYQIFCRTSDNTTVDRPVAFSVQSQEFATYSVQMPSDVIDIAQGTNESVQVTVFNNGTQQIDIGLGATSDCCRALFTDLAGDTVDRVSLVAGEGRVVNLLIDVPLYAETGRTGVITRFTKGDRTRAATATIRVQQSQYTEQLEALRSRADELQQTIASYRRAGIDTTELESRYAELQDALDAARQAVEQDDRDALRKRLSAANTDADSIQQRLDILALQQYIRTNWWKWLIGIGVFYILFVILTMVAIPYYRLRTEYLNVQDRLDNAVEARRKAEKQYFRREIDRSTFMNIMTERQDEILEMRSERDELEEELEHAIRRRLSLENFVKAPVKAVREIARWWQARMEEKEE